MEKRVLITGAAGGLGTAVTRRFLEAGHHVYALVDPNEEGKKERLQETAGPSSRLEIHAVDALDASAVETFVGEQFQDKQLDAALLLVGGFAMTGLADSSWGDFDKMIQLNFKTAFNFCKFCLPKMPEGGRLVLMGARPALEAGSATGMIPYSISKGMVLQLADIINAKYQKKNIQAAVVFPSIIDTPANRKAMPDADFNQWVRPEEIAEAMLYACSPAAGKQRAPFFKMYGGV